MKNLLNRIGWTQSQLARDLDTSENTVSKWCKTDPDTLAYRATVRYLECLARAMGK